MNAADSNWETPPPVPRVLTRKLAHLSRKVVRVHWIMGLICLVATVCILLTLQLSADWLFDLSRTVRAGLLVLDAGILCALLWFFGIRPWTKRLNQEQAALRAEKHWPNLRTSVISAVQLSRRFNGSSTLVEELLRQVGESVKNLDFRQAVSTKHLQNPAYGVSGLVALTALGLALGWPASGVLLKRAALANIPLPTQTIVVPISGDMEVPPGTTVELAARAQGVIPKSGRVEIVYEDQKPLVLTLSPKPTEPDVFATSLQNLQQPFTYRIFLNDGRSEEFTVKVIRGPVLESLSFEQHYPAYTGLEPTQHTAGNLNLLSGGKLRIAGRSDQTLTAARLVLEPRARESALNIADGKSVSGELDIPTEELSSFTIVLTNQEGTNSVNNTVYHVALTPDLAPSVLFGENQPSFQTIVPATKPRLTFEVRDDYLVKEVTFCARVEAGEEGKVFRIPLSIPQPGARLGFDHIIQDPAAAGLPWAVGTTLTYWIEAKDNNDVTGPGIGSSTERQWSIISVEAKRQEIMEKLSKSASDIRSLSQVQEDLRDTVEKIAPAAETPAP